jgi:hypothetical protein
MAKKTKKTEAADLAVVQAELEPVRTGVEQALAFAAQVPLDAEIAMFGETMSGRKALDKLNIMAREQLKNIEEKRTSVTKPLLEAKRAADALFDPTKQLIKALIDCCASRLAEDRKQFDAARTQALAAVNAGARDEATLAVVHAASVELESSTRTVWRVVVEDFAKVPDEFKVFNESLASAYARSKKGVCQIPGCKVLQEVKVGG